MEGRNPDNKNREVKRLLTFLAVSLLIHLISIFSAGEYSLWRAARVAATRKPVIVKLAPSKTRTLSDQEKKMQIVQQKKTKMNEPDNKDADFWSMQNQRAEKQTRAQRIDDFSHHPENVSALPPQPGLKAQRESQPSKKQTKKDKQRVAKETTASRGRGKGRAPQRPSSKELVKNLFSSLDQELMQRQPASAAIPESSATDDYLQDIKMGNKTMLNTREFKFYSYFERVRTQLKQYWRPLIQQKFDQMATLEGGVPRVKGEKITRLHVQLDNEGRITKINVLQSSGIGEIDSAAIEAFDRAGPFPNPPSGLIEKTGGINLQWDFVLVVNS